MKCSEVEKYLPDFFKGDLEQEIKSKIKVHIEECSACRLEAKSLNMMWEKLDEIPEEMPSAKMDERFDALIEAYQTGIERGRSEVNFVDKLNEWFARLLPRTPSVQFALISAIFVVGIFFGSNFGGVSGEVELLQKNMQQLNMVVASALNQSSPSERFKQVLAFGNQNNITDESLQSLLAILSADPNPSVQLASLDILNKFVDRENIRTQLLEILRTQDSPYIQAPLIELFVTIKEKQAIKIFTELLMNNKTNSLVRTRLNWGIQQLN